MARDSRPGWRDKPLAESSHQRGPLEIVAHVARRTFTRLGAPPAARPSPEVEGTVQFVLEHFRDDITLDDLARAAGLSKYHFIRKFRKEAGITPGAFLLRYRMVRAMELLTRTDAKIREVASAVGYRDPAAFSRAFLRTTGTKPYLYRQTRRGRESGTVAYLIR